MSVIPHTSTGLAAGWTDVRPPHYLFPYFILIVSDLIQPLIPSGFHKGGRGVVYIPALSLIIKYTIL